MAKIGTNANDWIWGSNYHDEIFGFAGNDVLWGFGGDDVIWGGADSDVLDGGDGNDRLEGGPGADALFGGSGNDTASYEFSPAGVAVSLYDQFEFAWFGDAEGDKLDSIENLRGSKFNDVFWGDDNNNTLNGFEGNDVLSGFGGHDSIYGGDGNDSLYGGASYDTLDGGSGDDRLYGGMGGDTLTGGLGADTFVWTDPAESAAGWTMDVIMDIDLTQGDVVDLSAIDADIYTAGNQAFTFIGPAAFSGAPGELRWYQSGNHTVIEMQTDADADAEGQFSFLGAYGPYDGWFVL